MTADGDFSLSDAPVPEWRVPEDDDDFDFAAGRARHVERLRRAGQLCRPMEGNADALGAAYPDANRPYDASQADAALVSHLAFLTGRHGERIKRIMLRSGLVRDKWHREDHWPRTISGVLARPGDVLTDRLPEPASLLPEAAAQAPTQADVTGQTFLGPDAQKTLCGVRLCPRPAPRFNPGGVLLKPDHSAAAFLAAMCSRWTR